MCIPTTRANNDENREAPLTRATKIKTVTVRIPAALHDELLRRADLEERSISSITRRCISSALADAQTANGVEPGVEVEGGPGATPVS